MPQNTQLENENEINMSLRRKLTTIRAICNQLHTKDLLHQVCKKTKK